MRIAISAAGSRGDVQPLAGLAVELAGRGHQVRLITDGEFAPLVEGRGVEFRAVSGDVREELERATAFFARGADPIAGARALRDIARRHAKTGVPELRDAVRGSDLLVTSGPGVFFGISIAESLGIPFVQAYLQPVIPTRAFSTPLQSPPKLEMPGWVNYGQHIIGAQLYWQLFRPIVNEARREVLGLPPWPLQGPRRMIEGPILLAHSRHVVPRPEDWDETVHVTGYWFLDQAQDWSPPADLVRFLESGPPPVYIGFGSMMFRDARQTSELVLEALRLAGRRAVVSAGWGGLRPAQDSPDIFQIDAAPHDWLFPRVAAVVHHGGAGTTAAALRAGKPSVVTPFIADQFFWAWRLEKCGVAPPQLRQDKLTAEDLGRALVRVLNDPEMAARAQRLGALIRQEDGVAAAAAVIERTAQTSYEPPRALAG